MHLANNDVSFGNLTPCRFVRRGRAAKGDDKDFELASDVEDGELITWLEKPGLSTALQLIQSKDSKKMTKFPLRGRSATFIHSTLLQGNCYRLLL